MTHGESATYVGDSLTAKLRGAAPTLCVSLIQNDPALATAVEAAGADGIKVHLNLEHKYAGVRLGTLEEELDALQAVIDAVSVPVGVVPRGTSGTTTAEVVSLAELGFAFIDLYTSVMSPTLLAVPGIAKWVAPKAAYGPTELEALSLLPGVDVIEAAFLSPETYGAPLSVDDVVRLRVGLRALDGRKPLVLPTDRSLTESDVLRLKEVGIDNFLIGYAVTGNELSQVVDATERFRRAVDD